MLIAVDDVWQLAGIAAWKRSVVEGTQVRPGKYGELSVGVRLQHYAEWIAETIERTAANEFRKPGRKVDVDNESGSELPRATVPSEAG
jgi:hypothetical protein